MASSMLAGERRWARRGGMTVLGKVAVPKPLNLPSQRLENHGLDPNVEIVPKGTLSWGNRSSSSTSNAWSSSMQSPNADGGTSSPSHLSARPSSSGSCTRPSTAGSDRAHEPTANAWSSNSRPSSASGTLASNQTSSTSLRPRSAETRPNSSQLSRFAEPTPESSVVAWGPSSAADRLGMKPSKEDGFSLSSGDFPTLGSDRDGSVKNVELPDHGPHDHPSSVSDRMSQEEGMNSAAHDVAQSGTNRWNRDGTRNAADMEKWQEEPQQYYHPNVPPQHFDSWRGAPLNAPPGVWYRGPPGRPSFGAPVGPGGFPMEPFPYHRPQVVPVPLGGSQPVPPPVVGPRGPHPKNGDLYRAQMPDAYARPAMPFRPGFYPGPMPFDNYYGPPMGYCNASEREIPYMGRAAGPPVFNRFPSPNAPDPSYSHGRPDGRGSMGKTLLEKVETDNLKGAQGFHSVPLKNKNEWEEGESWEQNLPSNASYHGKDGLLSISTRKSEWGADDDDDDDVENDIFGKQTAVHENASRSIEDHSSNILKVKSLKSMGNVKAVENNWTQKAETVASLAPENPRRPSESERDSSLLAPTKDSALMQKIEVLNAKARATDGRNDIPFAYSREEQRCVSHVAEAKANNSTIEVGSTAGSSERTASFGDIAPLPHKEIAPAGDKMSQSTALVSRRAYHGGQGRVDYRGKGNFVSQNDDGSQKKFDVITASTVESSSDSNACDTENLVKDGGQSCAESYDSTDIEAQRAKMRETAKQRALQLQKEEEERTREQKAKALAKLEELNRRTQASEAGIQKAERTQGTQKVETAQGNDVILIGQEVLCTIGEQATGLKFHAPGPTLAPVSAIAYNDREIGASHAREFDNISRNLPPEAPRTSHLEGICYGQCSILKHDSYNTGASNAFEHADGKQKYPSWTNLNEKSSPIVTGEEPKDLAEASVNDVPLTESASSVRARGETNAPNASNIIAEPSTKQRRKYNRNSKNKERMNEAAVVSPIPPVMLDESNPAKECVENEKSKALLPNLDSSVSPKIEPDGGVRASEVQPSLHDEEAHSRVSKHMKTQARRMPQRQQPNRNVDKFHSNDTVVWAPVRPQSKVEGADEAIKKPAPNSATPAKIDNLVQNSSKGKRAEMERYIPKPVAKELAQQGSTQPVPFPSSPTPEEGADKAQPETVRSVSPPPNRSATGIVGSGLDSKDGDGRPHKQGKAHGTWRQRNTEQLNRKSAHHGQSATSNPTKDIQGSTDHSQFQKREMNASKSEPNTSRENSLLDRSNISNDIESAVAGKSLAVKDQVATGRGKRYSPKGNKITGNNHDPDHTNLVSDSAVTDVEQTDMPIPSKESHGPGERISSQWQPKPHRDSDNQKRGRAPRTETVNMETDRSLNRDHRSQRKMHVAPQYPEASLSESNMANGPNVGHHQEFFTGRKHAPVKDVGPHQEPRERKPSQAKGRPYSPKQVPVDESAPAAANIAGEHDHKFSSGFRRNANQNNRSGRGHESHGDWSLVYDNQQHNVPAFRERQRQNVQHYEYQPVQQYKNSKTDKHGEGSNDTVPRYRERNQSHPKRDGGNYHRRQGGPTPVDSGHD